MSVFDSQLMDLIVPTSMDEESRCFFESYELPKPSKERIENLKGLVVVEDSWSGGPGLSPWWYVLFTYRDFRFLVESNSHAGLAYFFVDDLDCPKGVMIEVLEHFNSIEGVCLVEDEDSPTFEVSFKNDLKEIGCAIVLIAVIAGLCLLLNLALNFALSE